MHIEVTSRCDSIPTALREYAQDRLAGVERLGEEFEKSEIIFQKEHDELICEVILHRHRGEPFVATGKAREGRSAVDGAASKLEKQFIRFKEKHSHKGRRHRAEE
ncbi:MAG: ribosomal subunit interface protein [Planctomycetes bacterium]|jgi:ribosomal subunit interface protein|nr:ribosomal subunit interface protein [Planctomycetota bacterium]|tara:strand:+ start:7401 stop:7715 length:315 start_codon:yes stop_codon:yes gene_type:complete